MTYEKARHPKRDKNNTVATEAHSPVDASRNASSPVPASSVGAAVARWATNDAKGIAAKVATHASMQKSSMASVPKRRRSFGMQSLSGIDTAPMAESARPIWAGCSSNLQCSALDVRGTLREEEEREEETYGEGEAAFADGRVRHEHEGVREA